MIASRLLHAFALLFITAFGAALPAQAYPEKPVKFIVAFGAGSATDTAARFVGQAIFRSTGQPVVVENRGGANGFIAAQAVANAAPDGYTVLVTTQSTHAANPALFRKLPYDPVKDFAPVSTISRAPLILVASPSLPANNLAELTALAKRQPGKLSFGSGNMSSRAGGELYKALAGVDLLHVPYQSAPKAMTDLMGGQIQLIWADVVTGMAQVNSGKVKALATTGTTRLSTAADVPTVREQGLPGAEIYAWVGVYLPAKTPRAIVERLGELVRAAVKSDPAFFDRLGSEVFALEPAEFAKFQAAETALWARIVRTAGIEPE